MIIDRTGHFYSIMNMNELYETELYMFTKRVSKRLFQDNLKYGRLIAREANTGNLRNIYKDLREIKIDLGEQMFLHEGSHFQLTSWAHVVSMAHNRKICEVLKHHSIEFDKFHANKIASPRINRLINKLSVHEAGTVKKIMDTVQFPDLVKDIIMGKLL